MNYIQLLAATGVKLFVFKTSLLTVFIIIISFDSEKPSPEILLLLWSMKWDRQNLFVYDWAESILGWTKREGKGKSTWFLAYLSIEVEPQNF